ncbi:MAG: lysylphosphatidylglycerol synthase transmembrane domain-containing protein [Byssovorax sp.]
MNKLVRRVLAVMLLAVFVYGAIFFYKGIGKITHEFGHFAWWAFGAGLGLAFLNYVLRFFRWQYYLRLLKIEGVPWGESFLTFFSGFVLTVTPGKVGEVFKSLILFQLRGVPIQKSAPIVVAERVTDLIGVITMIAIGSLSFPGGAIWASAGGVVVLMLLGFIAAPTFSERMISAILPRLPGGLGRFGAKITPKLIEALEQLRELTTPGRLVFPTLLSIVAWSSEGVALWVILRGFGEAAPVTITVFLYATATLAGALIPVPGGLGITEGLLTGQMESLAHVAPGVSASAMLLGRLATLWFAVGLGFIALGILRAKHPQLSADPEPAPAPAEKTP